MLLLLQLLLRLEPVKKARCQAVPYLEGDSLARQGLHEDLHGA